MSNELNLFISHHGDDEEKIESFKNLLANNNYTIKDGSIVESEPNNANNPDYIKQIIGQQIKWAGTLIVLVGPKTNESDWVDWEIEYAMKHEKRIVGVFLQGAADSDLPNKLEEYGDACVTWSAEKIIDAIKGNDIWETSEGEVRPDSGTHITCW